MKRAKVSLTVTLAAAALLSFATACSDSRPAQRGQSRAAFDKIERGTGEALEGAGDAVGAGVNKLDRTWETPQEQRMERQLDENDQNRRDNR